MAEGSARPMRLDDLLADLQLRLEGIVSSRRRTQLLLDAVVSLGSDLTLETVLQRVVEAARSLAGARYGALGIVGQDGRFRQFQPSGMPAEQIAAMPRPPSGAGLLGLLLDEPGPLRVPDITAHPAFTGFPDGHPVMGSFLGVPIRALGVPYCVLYLTEKEGGDGFDEDDEALVAALAAAAGVAVENARLLATTQQREGWLAASAEVMTALLSGAHRDEVFRLIVRLARQIVDADTSAMVLPSPAEGMLRVEITDGPGAEILDGIDIPIGQSIIGQVFRTGAAELIDDIGATGAPVVVSRVPMGPGVQVPFGAPGQVRGVLGCARRPGRLPFTEADMGMAQQFAAQAALALELAEARGDTERLILLEDRDRIAKDLHDLVIQRLFAVAMRLVGAARLSVDPEVASRVQTAVNELDETIQQIRSTIFDLQLRQEAGETWRARVVEVLRNARFHLGFAPGLSMEGFVDSAMPEEVGEHLLAVLREALSNVARHAHASAVRVLITIGDAVLLRVEDDGVGISAEGRRSGLRNLAERAARLGGSFEVRSRDGGGTWLEWRVPL
ncbi:GAF domain-containing protein [Nonomuraea sp. NPDC050556]|uniref:sensor histidine kinase n=1 Tax=Nonomuraea sp. NPDC050556 TaxID=3364369 RepID=UPI0037A43C53